MCGPLEQIWRNAVSRLLLPSRQNCDACWPVIDVSVDSLPALEATHAVPRNGRRPDAAPFFAGCSGGVLEPQGPIASAQRLLLINFVLAFAQIGVHLVFFLHLGSGPDSTNNILALAFGVLIVFLVIAGSVWIFANLNSNVMPMLTQ